jgi:hypothetical protein
LPHWQKLTFPRAHAQCCPCSEKFTLEHDTLDAADISEVRALGVSEEAITGAF